LFSSTKTIIIYVDNYVICYFVFQPKTGVLGTHKKAVIFEMLQAGKFFPEGYFWEVFCLFQTFVHLVLIKDYLMFIYNITVKYFAIISRLDS